MTKKTCLLFAFGLLVFVSGPAVGAEITAQSIPGAYDDQFDTVGFQNLSTSGNDTFVSTGDEFILLRNTTSTDSQVRVISVEDDFGRKDDLVDTVPANSTTIVGPMVRKGWRNGNGNIEITAEDGINSGDIKVAIIRQ